MGNKHVTLDDILAEDMHHWYNKFMRESPSGLITLFELKSILGLQRMPEDANGYVDQVFCTFDMDGVRTEYEKSLMYMPAGVMVELLISEIICWLCHIGYSGYLLDVNLNGIIHGIILF